MGSSSNFSKNYRNKKPQNPRWKHKWARSNSGISSTLREKVELLWGEETITDKKMKEMIGKVKVTLP